MKTTLILLYVVLSFAVVNAEEITAVTEDYPPYNYEENGKVTGLSTEIVKATLDEAEIKYSIKTYPWSRAIEMAENGENVLIFTITRNKERERNFKWVGPIDQRPIFNAV